MKTVLYTGPHLWNVFVVDDGVVFEQGTFNSAPILFHVHDEVREIARLPVGRPRGVLQGVEDGRLIVLENHLLTAYRIRDGERTMLRDLQRPPAAIAITPEQVVWAISESRFLDGAGTDGLGQVWRWWRGTDDIECLGEQASFRPDLAVATGVIPSGAMTSPVYIAADHELGVIDTQGLHWLTTEPQPISFLACSADAVLYATNGQVIRRDHVTGEARVVYRATIPMYFTVYENRLVVTRNTVVADRQVVERSNVTVIDLATGEGVIVAEDIGRPAAVAADEGGIYLVEGSLDYGGSDRLVHIPWDASAIGHVAAEPELDDAVWQYAFSIQWWRFEGDGGYFSLDREGVWAIHSSSAPASGRLDPASRLRTLRQFDAWRRQWHPAAGAYVDLSINRGWLVAWGLDAWFRAAREPSDAVEAACELVIAICPAFADIVRALP